MENKIYTLIALIFMSINTNAQFLESRASSIPITNQVGLELGTQKLRQLNNYEVALTRILNGGSRFYLIDRASNSAKIVESYDFGLQDMIVKDFEILGDTIYFCGNYFNGSIYVGYIARANYWDLFTGGQFFISDIGNAFLLNNLQVYYNVRTMGEVRVAAIGYDINSMQGVYVNYIIPNPIISGNEFYESFTVTGWSGIDEVYHDITVTDNFIGIVGNNGSTTSQQFIIRVFDKYNPFNYSSNVFTIMSGNNSIRCSEFKAEALDGDNIATGTLLSNIGMGANSGLLMYEIDLNTPSSILTSSLSAINQSLSWLKDLEYDNYLDKLYALITDGNPQIVMNYVYTFDMTNTPSYPYFENRFDIPIGQYGLDISFSGLNQYQQDILTLVGKNDNREELHLFEKVISNNTGNSTCHIINLDSIQSFNIPIYPYNPPINNNSGVSPSTLHNVFILHDGKINIDCIY